MVKTSKVSHKHIFSMQLCRLCGVKKVCGINLCSPESMQSGIISKINNHLTKQIIHITAEDAFSKYICANCELTITNFVKFCEIVKTAQRRLEKEKLVYSPNPKKPKISSKTASNSRKSIQSILPAAHEFIEDLSASSSDEDSHKIVKTAQRSLEKEKLKPRPNPKKPNISSKSATNSRKSLRSILPAALEFIDIETTFQEDLSASSSDADSDVPTVTVGPNGQFVCLKCQKHLDTVEQTTFHMITHGTGTVICSCRVCGKQGKLKQFVTNTSGEPTVWCSHGCFVGTEKKTKKNKVTSSLSDGHACGVCPKVFRSQAHKSRHAVIHSGDKPFLCHICGTGFSQIESLKVHSRTHEEADPHKCPQCGQKFRFKVSLQSHVLSQHATADSKHVCDRCGKQFATAYKLQRHYRQHTGEKPFQCAKCAKLFSQSGNLHKHMRKIHKEVYTKKAAVPVASVEPAPPLLTELQNAVTYIQPPIDVNSSSASAPTSLVTILEEDTIPCNSNTEISSQRSPFVSFSQDPSRARHTAYQAVPSLNTNTKLNQRKSLGRLFGSYEDGGLLYTDKSNEHINEVTLTSDGVTLPTFSSLQLGASSCPTSGHVHSAI